MPKFRDMKKYADVWKPQKPGDKLTGTLEAVRQTEGGQYGPSTVLDFTTAEGSKSVFADKVLEGYADHMEIGTTYRLEFTGWGKDNAKKQTNKNRYRNWKVQEAET